MRYNGGSLAQYCQVYGFLQNLRIFLSVVPLRVDGIKFVNSTDFDSPARAKRERQSRPHARYAYIECASFRASTYTCVVCVAIDGERILPCGSHV